MVYGEKQKFRTETINNDLNPVWNSKPFSFTFEQGAGGSVQFEVFDCDWLSFDDSLGKTEFDVGTLPSGEWQTSTESLGDGKGEIMWKVRVERQESTRVEKSRDIQAQVEQEQEEAIAAAKANAEEGAGDIVTISIKGAHNLKNTDRGLFRREGDCSDPYVIVTAGDQTHRTETIENNLDPCWDPKQVSLTLGDDKQLKLDVFDSDLLTFDDPLGSVQIDAGALEAGMWHTLEESLGEGNGEIMFDVRLERQIQTRVEKSKTVIAELADEMSNALGAAKAEAEADAGRVVYVQIIAGHNLENTESRIARMMGNASDPYVVVSVGDSTLKTNIIRDNLNPTWEEDVFKFETNDVDTPLKLEMFDNDFFTQDDSMGTIQIEIGNLELGDWIHHQQGLEGGKGELEFNVRVEAQPRKRIEKVRSIRETMWQKQEEMWEKLKEEFLASK